MAGVSTNPCTWKRVLNDMAIIETTDTGALQEIRYLLDPEANGRRSTGCGDYHKSGAIRCESPSLIGSGYDCDRI